MQATYNVGQEGVLRYGLENGMLADDAPDLGVAPQTFIAGYGTLPGINREEGTQVIDSVGSYQGVDTQPGTRTPDARFTLKVGNVDFLRYGLRNSGITPNYKCLPVLALLGGASGACDPTQGFSWMVRYALCNTMGLQFSEGAPISANMEFMGLAVDPDEQVKAMNFATELPSLARRVLMWHHTDFIIGGVSYRSYLKSVQVQISNGVVRIGERNELGWNNPMSRINYALAPTQERVNVTYSLHARLARYLIDAARNSGDWGAVVLRASDAAVNSINPKTMNVVISNNMLKNLNMEAIEAGQPFSFSASTVSRNVGITVNAGAP